MADGITITISAKTADAATQIADFFSGVTNKLNQLAGAGAYVQELGGKIAAAFTLGAIVEQFKKAVDSTLEFGRAVEKTGLSFQSLSALKKIGQENDIAFEEMTLAMALFNNRIFEAVRLGGEAARPFRDLHVQLTSASGAMLGTEAVLRQVMDRFHEMPDGIEKTGLAMELFPRVGRQLVPIFNEGAAALDRFKGTQGGITPEMVENARAFERSWVELENSMRRVFTAASAQIVPILQQLTDDLNKAEGAENNAAKASDFLVAIFKGLVTVAETLNTDFNVLVQGGIGAIISQVKIMADAVETVITIFVRWGNGIKEIGNDLMDIGKRAAGAASILKDLATGHFKEARDEAQKFTTAAAADFSKMGSTVKSTLSGSISDAAGFVERSLIEGKAAFDVFSKELTDEAFNLAGKIQALWFPKNVVPPGQKKAPVAPGTQAQPAQAAVPGAAGADGSLTPQVSEEGKKLIDDIEKQWREATEGKLALLDQDKQETLKKLKDEFDSAVKNETVYNQERLKVEQTFAARRQEILDEQADHQSKAALGGIQAKIEGVNKNPDLTEVERKQQLLPLLEQERALLEQIVQLKTGELGQSNRSDDDKVKLQDQIAELKKQIADLQAEKSKTAQNPLQQVQVELQNQNNLQKQVATSFGNVFNTAINSVSSNLTAVIMKTESWRQALAKIGETILSSIINAIIQMGMRWILMQIEQATVGKAIASAGLLANTGIAAAQSAIWTGPAILSTIASYGAAAEDAPGLVEAAVAEGELGSAVGGFAEGGLVDGPGTGTSDSIFARLSRGEFVIPADRVNAIGIGALEAIRNGSDLAQAIPGALTRPITSQPDVFQQIQADAAARASGGAPANGVTVQGHKVTFIQPSNRQEMLDAMRSSEGEKIWVQHGQKNKMKIGVGS